MTHSDDLKKYLSELGKEIARGNRKLFDMGRGTRNVEINIPKLDKLPDLPRPLVPDDKAWFDAPPVTPEMLQNMFKFKEDSVQADELMKAYKAWDAAKFAGIPRSRRSTLMGIPVVEYGAGDIVPIEEGKREMIFVDEDELPKVLSQDWIEVTNAKDSDGIKYEAHRLMANEYEQKFIADNYPDSKKEVGKMTELLWIVRSAPNDTDQRIMTTQEMSTHFQIEKEAGSPKKVIGSIAQNNVLFWATSVAFISNDSELKPDGDPRANVFGD